MPTTAHAHTSQPVRLGLALMVLCLGVSGLSWWGYRFTTGQVGHQLGQEKIYFPSAGTPALDPKEFPGLQKYGGQQVDTGDKAKAYADEFIWVHMMKASGGRTYAEVSTAAMASPQDARLAGLKQTLFMGDMLRSSLLTAYAFSRFGVVALWAAGAGLVGAVAALLFVLLARRWAV